MIPMLLSRSDEHCGEITIFSIYIQQSKTVTAFKSENHFQHKKKDYEHSSLKSTNYSITTGVPSYIRKTTDFGHQKESTQDTRSMRNYRHQ